ncbi:MAG TPA: DUF1501 domain-containing protein, partial [Armatimonadota bacterium]|nr:DUF1501 domain-containing protein [Armatimonadota bacterium]
AARETNRARVCLLAPETGASGGTDMAQRAGGGHRHNIGIDRRELVQVGFTGLLGLGMADVLGGRAAQAAPLPRPAGGPRAKSVVLVFMTGAPAHQDIWDIDMNRATEYRGDARAIKTNVPGIEISEHLPMLAKLADRYSIVRSMHHGTNVHEFGTHYMLTGIDQIPPSATHFATRADWPAMGSIVSFARPSTSGLPSAVILPTYLNAGYGFSGQHGGIMGSRHDPWIIDKDPSKPDFRVPDLQPSPGMTAERLDNRRALLRHVEKQRRDLDGVFEVRQLSESQQRAFTTLTAPQTRDAFDLTREPQPLRERYGMHAFGQSLLLARRLVEAGVGLVQANMGAMNNWDTHTDNFGQLKNRLLPPFDRAFSAFLEDLTTRGLLDDTLVIAVGEFGRTPKVGTDNGGGITGPGGRDHWGGVFSAVWAGGGVQGGRIIGKSDETAAFPDGQAYLPSDLSATVFTALGINPRMDFHDIQGRPFPVSAGNVIQPLF